MYVVLAKHLIILEITRTQLHRIDLTKNIMLLINSFVLRLVHIEVFIKRELFSVILAIFLSDFPFTTHINRLLECVQHQFGF